MMQQLIAVSGIRYDRSGAALRAIRAGSDYRLEGKLGKKRAGAKQSNAQMPQPHSHHVAQTQRRARRNAERGRVGGNK